MSTINDVISRIRNSMKLVSEDAFITDRYIYSLVRKYGEALIYRDSQIQNIYKDNDKFKEIPCFPMREISVIEPCCANIDTGCVIMKSVYKLPNMVKLNSGSVIRSVSSIDYSTQCHVIQPSVYATMRKSSSFKYNKTKYYWIVDGYLYVPDVMWEAVRIQAMFDDDISDFLCSDSSSNDGDECKMRQEEEIFIPEHTLAEVEQMVLREMMATVQIPSDTADDNQHIMRS